MPHFTGFVGMYCLKPSLPLYLTIPSSIETNFDGRYSLRNVLASLSNKGRTLKSLSSTSRSNSLALLYSKQNFQREECMHFFACCCMPPQVWFCLNALFSMTVGFLHNFFEQIFWSEKEKEIQSCSIFWNLWSWTSAFDKFFNMDRRVIYRPVLMCSRFHSQKLKYQIHHLIAFAKLLLFLLL